MEFAGESYSVSVTEFSVMVKFLTGAFDFRMIMTVGMMSKGHAHLSLISNDREESLDHNENQNRSKIDV